MKDQIEISAYDPNWPLMFAAERDLTVTRFPSEMIRRIEHFGSTAVPNLAAKPIIDMLIEVPTVTGAIAEVGPCLARLGYECYSKPSRTPSGLPRYLRCIKRNALQQRTHHLNFIELEFVHWDRLFFRDYLRLNDDVAREYECLKRELAKRFPSDRVAYTEGKTEFIAEMTARAKRHFATLTASTLFNAPMTETL